MIALITNLPNNDHFLKYGLGSTNTQELLAATGGNTGNVAFVHAVQSILANEYQVIDWGSSPKIVKEKFSHIVICCANQIGAHVDLKGWADRLRSFDLPVTLIGLGAQSNKIGDIPIIPGGTISFLKEVQRLNKCSSGSNIATRGHFSSKVLKHYGFDSAPNGCPSLLTSPDKYLGQTCLKNQNSKTYKRIMVPAGNPYHPSSLIEQMLVDLVKNYDGEYVLQHPELLFSLVLNKDIDLDAKKRALLNKVYPDFKGIEDLSSWLKAKSVFFADAPNWLNYAKKFSTAIGPRYHGIALPIQVGVPGRVIAIDSRTEELAVTTGVPYIHYKDVVNLNLEELANESSWTGNEAKAFDKYRHENSNKYVDFLKSNGLTAQSHLHKI